MTEVNGRGQGVEIKGTGSSEVPARSGREGFAGTLGADGRVNSGTSSSGGLSSRLSLQADSGSKKRGRRRQQQKKRGALRNLLAKTPSSP